MHGAVIHKPIREQGTGILATRHFSLRTVVCGLLFAQLCSFAVAAESSFPEVFDTQDPGDGLTSPPDALRGIKVPPGFHVSLFAAEPDVRQPIALAMDDRGRLWVAENYTYADSAERFDTNLHDRIVILEDVDGDGVFDRRKVFWDEARKLSSIEIGFGGVWALCAPHLLFIPDQDSDDVPDGEPVVMLDGWNADEVGHNIVNGLRWGPDGWLYGRHGIAAMSSVGTPGMSPIERTRLNCCIWRFHPTSKTFEVVAQGTTNPWGMDWDDHGQMFFINTVIGHLWHVVPGALYERMYGEHFNPHAYQLIQQTADHVHWDTTEAWHDTQSKGLSRTTDQAGGGHAHTGMMIYLGGNWPDKYRGTLFTANLLGRRINNDRLDRHGAGYVGTHAADFLTVEDPWFRGIELCYGPDGGVYIADWSDIGECHDNDGIHRTSGRIYKVAYAHPNPVTEFDLSTLSHAQLVQLQLHKNDWYVRHARRLLHERAVAGEDTAADEDTADGDWGGTQETLLTIFETHPDITRKLRALWCLHVTGGADEQWLLRQLDHANEHVRAWVVKLLVDRENPSARVRDAFEELASRERSGLVLSFLASALHRLPADERLTLGTAISNHQQFADDPALPLMVWYGIEPAVVGQAEQAVQLASSSQLPSVRRHIARRLTYEIERRPEAVARLVGLLGDQRSVQFEYDILAGMSAALEGWQKAPLPDGWNDVASSLRISPDETIRRLERELSLVFGDGRALDELFEIATGGDNLDSRRAAIRTLVAGRVAGLVPTLQELLKDPDLTADAVRGLSAYNDPETPQSLLDQMGRLPRSGREEVINVLVSRPAYAHELLDAVAAGNIDRELVSAFQIRQMQTFGDERVSTQVDELWPELKTISADKAAKINEYQSTLTTEHLASADLSAGRTLFEKSCASCHKLFGRGGTIGPDLTGAQRSNLHYLLQNIVDPSATVSKNYHMTIVLLEDGRVINGIITAQTERTITLEMPQQRLVIARHEIDEMRESEQSLMPDRQLDVLGRDAARDLIGYLMSPGQVPLPGVGSGHAEAFIRGSNN